VHQHLGQWLAGQLWNGDPVGYPADGVTVPQLSRKPLSEVLVHR